MLAALAIAWLVADQAGPPPEPPPPATPTTATTSTDDSPEQQFKRGKNAFEYADCANALLILGPLAVPGKLQDEKEQVEVYRMLGVCYAMTDKQLEAAREFSSLLSINPDYDLDRLTTPPKAVEVFERQKDAMRAQLEEIRRAREKANVNVVDPQGGILVERTVVVKDVPIAVAFMPFGLAQAANGATVKAVIVGTVQGVTLASTVTLFWTSMALLAQPHPNDTEDKVAALNGVVVAQWLSAVGFAGAYLYGVADGLWNRDDGGVVDKKQTRRTLTPDEAKDASKVVTPP